MLASSQNKLTIHIFIGLLAGVIVGISINYLNQTTLVEITIVNFILSSIEDIVAITGQLFLNAMRMLVIPIIFFSLISGTANLANPKKLGSIGIKTLLLFLSTTIAAILMALIIAYLFNVGSSNN